MDYVELESGASFTIVAISHSARPPSEFEEFVGGLTESEQEGLYNLILFLAEHGATHNPTKFNPLGDGFFELKSGQDRAIYFYWTCPRTGCKCAVITHGFRKRTRRTPPEELKKAKRRRREFLEVFGH